MIDSGAVIIMGPCSIQLRPLKQLLLTRIAPIQTTTMIVGQDLVAVVASRLVAGLLAVGEHLKSVGNYLTIQTFSAFSLTSVL